MPNSCVLQNYHSRDFNLVIDFSENHFLLSQALPWTKEKFPQLPPALLRQC